MVFGTHLKSPTSILKYVPVFEIATHGAFTLQEMINDGLDKPVNVPEGCHALFEFSPISEVVCTGLSNEFFLQNLKNPAFWYHLANRSYGETLGNWLTHGKKQAYDQLNENAKEKIDNSLRSLSKYFPGQSFYTRKLLLDNKSIDDLLQEGFYIQRHIYKTIGTTAVIESEYLVDVMKTVMWMKNGMYLHELMQMILADDDYARQFGAIFVLTSCGSISVPGQKMTIQHQILEDAILNHQYAAKLQGRPKSLPAEPLVYKTFTSIAPTRNFKIPFDRRKNLERQARINTITKKGLLNASGQHIQNTSFVKGNRMSHRTSQYHYSSIPSENRNRNRVQSYFRDSQRYQSSAQPTYSGSDLQLFLKRGNSYLPYISTTTGTSTFNIPSARREINELIRTDSKEEDIFVYFPKLSGSFLTVKEFRNSVGQQHRRSRSRSRSRNRSNQTVKKGSKIGAGAGTRKRQT